MKKLFTTRNIISAILVCAILFAGVGLLIFDPFSQATETEQESEFDRIPIDRPHIQHTLPPDRLPVEPDDYPYFIPEVPSVQLSHIEWHEYRMFFYIPFYYLSKYVGHDNASVFEDWFYYESGLHGQEMLMVAFVEHFNISRETFDTLLNNEQVRAQRTYEAYGGSLWYVRDCINADIIFSGDLELVRNYYRDSYWITAQQLREQGFTDECWVPVETFDIILEQVAQEQAVAREQIAMQAQEIAAARR